MSKSRKHNPIRMTVMAVSVLMAPMAWADEAGTTGPVSLTQKQMLERLLSQNARAQFTRLESEIAETQVQFEEGVYQPRFFSSARYSDDVIPNSAEDETSRSDTSPTFDERRTEVEFGVQAPLITGGELSVSFSGLSRENTFTELAETAGSEYIGGFDFALRQPLWRNFMATETELAIDSARQGVEQSAYRSAQSLLELAYQGLRQYWLTYRRDAFVDIEARALDTAQESIGVTRALVSAGIQPAIAEMEVESRVIARRAEYDKARAALVEAQSDLGVLLQRDQAEDLAKTYQLEDSPETRALMKPENFSSYGEAVLAQWPEFKAAQVAKGIESNQFNLALETLKPSLDLVVGYSTQALNSGFTDTWDESFQDKYPSWYAGVELSVKIGRDQQSQARATASSLRMRQADYDLQAIRASVLNRLQARLTQANASYSEMQAMIERERLQLAIYDEQARRFEAGQIPVNVLHDAMDELIQVQRSVIDAKVSYQLALVAVRLVEGSLLAEYDVADLTGVGTSSGAPRRLSLAEEG